QATGDDKGMVATLKQALALDPKDGESLWLLFQRALARWQAGDRSVKKELEADARAYLASGYLAMGAQSRLAERTLVQITGDEVALAIHDARAAYQDAFTETGWGAINQRMGDARRGFEKCVAARPAEQQCHYYLGLVYSSVKASEQYDLARAKAELGKAPDL